MTFNNIPEKNVREVVFLCKSPNTILENGEPENYGMF